MVRDWETKRQDVIRANAEIHLRQIPEAPERKAAGGK
jgi:hypothetical protein